MNFILIRSSTSTGPYDLICGLTLVATVLLADCGVSSCAGRVADCLQAWGLLASSQEEGGD